MSYITWAVDESPKSYFQLVLLEIVPKLSYLLELNARKFSPRKGFMKEKMHKSEEQNNNAPINFSPKGVGQGALYITPGN